MEEVQEHGLVETQRCGAVVKLNKKSFSSLDKNNHDDINEDLDFDGENNQNVNCKSLSQRWDCYSLCIHNYIHNEQIAINIVS